MENKKTMDDVGRSLEELRKEAYEQGFEDGYDKGCMDMIDDDLGSSLDEEEE